MAQELEYRPKTGDIPTSPGVYRFFDSAGRILYVGKAKNLRSRLTSYFAPLDTLHERTRRMVTSAASVTWTTVGTEFEALQLEFTWIKEFDPPFNIQFRDDKSYPYLAITLGGEGTSSFSHSSTRPTPCSLFRSLHKDLGDQRNSRPRFARLSCPVLYRWCVQACRTHWASMPSRRYWALCCTVCWARDSRGAQVDCTRSGALYDGSERRTSLKTPCTNG